MTKALLAFALLPFTALAQLQLFVAPPNAETPVSGVFDCGSAPIGDRLDTRFRVRNTGSSTVTVTALHILGSSFNVINAPSVPHLLTPGNNIDFTVRFQPRDFGSYSGNLVVNGLSLLVRGSAAAGVSVKVDGTIVASGDTVDFGRTERGTPSKKLFQLENLSTQALTIQRVDLTGAGFLLSNPPILPATLAAKASLAYEVIFDPSTAGVASGSLTIDGRAFRLTAAGTEPPFDRPTVEISSMPTGSASQGKVAVRFPRPSRAKGSGVIRLSFTPVTGAMANDPGVLFLASGRKDIAFTVEEGDTAARFGTAADAVFQTGTTAGAFVLQASIGGFTEQSSFSVASSPVRIDQARALRNNGLIEMSISAFDNTHAATALAFTFYDKTGKAVQPGTIRVDAVGDFKRHFAKDAGGSFSLKAVFPVAGASADIVQAEVEVTNPTGSSKSEKIRF